MPPSPTEREQIAVLTTTMKGGKTEETEQFVIARLCPTKYDGTLKFAERLNKGHMLSVKITRTFRTTNNKRTRQNGHALYRVRVSGCVCVRRVQQPSSPKKDAQARLLVACPCIATLAADTHHVGMEEVTQLWVLAAYHKLKGHVRRGEPKVPVKTEEGKW